MEKGDVRATGGSKKARLNPILIDAFPSPPTHLPTTPTSLHSASTIGLPPKGPLPSPGGPPRITEHEVVTLLSSSTSIRSRISNASLDSVTPPSTPSSSLNDLNRPAIALDEADPVLPYDSAAKDSISSVQFPGDDEDFDDDLPTTTPAVISAQALHRHIRSARSRSSSHKQALQLLAKSPPPSSPRISPKRPEPSFPQDRPRSPDVSTLLTSTPRPKRDRSAPNLSGSSRSRSRSRANPRGPLKRRVSDGTESFPSRDNTSSDYRLSNRSWAEDEFVEDYGAPSIRSSRFGRLPYDDAVEDLDQESFEKLEKELEGDGGSDSDSSIDLHTPLPHLMVRHGLLSPHSKLLPGNSRTATPMTAGGGGRDSKASFVSTASVVTKSGVIKDDRDTPQRRVRHRDGKQLRGGLGLTTGLGWSDSEDEDAPSALTRRISTLNLSRKSSLASMSSSRSRPSRPRRSTVNSLHPLSRSFSSGNLLDDELPSRPKPSSRVPSRQSQGKGLPSRSRASGPSATEVLYTKSFHLPSRKASASETKSLDSSPVISTRTPAFAASGSIRHSGSEDSTDSSRMSHPHSAPSHSDETLPTSPSSSLSIPPSLMPKDEASTGQSTKAPIVSKLPSLRKVASNAFLGSNGGGLQRPRALSSGSSLATTGSASGPPPNEPLPPIPIPSTAPATTTKTPRPLQLPLAQRRGSLGNIKSSGPSGEKVAVPVPPVMLSTSARESRTSLGSSVSAPQTPNRISSEMPNSISDRSSSIARPKPRTGTGMVYRSSSISRRSGGDITTKIRAPGSSFSSGTVRQKPVPI